MSEQDHEQPTEAEEPAGDDLLAQQERKGYGEDEGEREEGLPDE